MKLDRPAAALPFILLLALGLRLNHINAPVLGTNSWRMADNSAMARGYLEPGGRGFCWPRVDWRGDGPGFVQSEFPAYPYAVSLLYRVFGVEDLPARALSAACSVAGVAFLYLAVLEVSASAWQALWAALFLSFLPLSVFYGRAIMAEPALLAVLTGGVWLFARWARTGSRAALLLAGSMVSFGCLLKLPYLHIGLPLLYLAWGGTGEKRGAGRDSGASRRWSSSLRRSGIGIRDGSWPKAG